MNRHDAMTALIIVIVLAASVLAVLGGVVINDRFSKMQETLYQCEVCNAQLEYDNRKLVDRLGVFAPSDMVAKYRRKVGEK